MQICTTERGGAAGWSGWVISPEILVGWATSFCPPSPIINSPVCSSVVVL